MHLSSNSATREAALAYLYARVNYEKSSKIPYQERHFKLDRMRQLLDRLGNPQQAVPAVHIAGTKGKGSTAAFTATVLRAAGYRTGIYTSPHLDRLEERFVVDGQPCSADELIELVDLVRSAVESERLDADATYFELTTAMAFLHFQRRQVDISVLEVGLGGRLDSTNVCWPIVTAITSISFDHQVQLGLTLPEIASEKAGILKPGVPVVCGVREPSARAVICQRSEQIGSPLRLLDKDFFYRFRWAAAVDAPSDATPPVARIQLDFWPSQRPESETPESETPESETPESETPESETPESESRLGLTLGLLGEHQAQNAATSLAVVEELRRLGWSISSGAEREGLAATVCPARVELVGNSPVTIIDAAHNVASCQALVSTLQAAFPRHRKTLIFATSQDKDAEGMLRVLLPQFDRAVLTRYRHNPRSTDPASLVETARRVLAEPSSANSPGPTVAVEPDPESAWQRATTRLQPDDLLCVTGSFFLAAELRGIAQLSQQEPPAKC